MEPEKQEKNLWQRYFKHRSAGQIATLITLLIAAIFVFVAITINVGKVSQKKTQLSNAADASSLQLNSQIGSYAHFLSCKYLKCKKKICKFSFAMFFKFIVTIAVGAYFGWVGAIIGVVLATAGAYIEAAQWAKISRQFKKMSQKMQFTEGAILAALQRTVDDPNQVQDTYDDDEDGLTDDRVQAFVQWYNERLRILDKKIIRPAQQAIDGLKTQMQAFDEKAQAFQPFIHDPAGDFIFLLGELEGCGYPPPGLWDLTFWQPGNPLPKQCEELYTPEQCEVFDEGCENDADPNDCAPCSPYDEYLANFYHDPVDSMDFEIGDLHEFASGIAAQTTEDLYKTIDLWKPLLYSGDGADPCADASRAGDYYSVLGRWIDDLAAWEDELGRVKAQVEVCMRSVNMCQTCDPLTGACSYDETLSCCCKLKDGLTLPQRIDSAIAKLDAFRDEAIKFQGEIAGFNSSVGTIEEQNIEEGQTKRKALYSWQDTYIKEGKKEPFWHHVKVEVNKFDMPRIKTYVIDFVKCAKLKHAKQTVWVEIKRYDQGQESYPFWKFRYHGLPEEPASPGEPGSIDEAYWLMARSHGRYSYKKEPPKVVEAK